MSDDIAEAIAHLARLSATGRGARSLVAPDPRQSYARGDLGLDGPPAPGSGLAGRSPALQGASVVGNPPEEHRFKPGESGNPSGKPKGARSITTCVRRILESDDPHGWVCKDGYEQTAKRLVTHALLADDPMRAIDTLLGRIDGPLEQRISHNVAPPPLRVIDERSGEVEVVGGDGDGA